MCFFFAFGRIISRYYFHSNNFVSVKQSRQARKSIFQTSLHCCTEYYLCGWASNTQTKQQQRKRYYCTYCIWLWYSRVCQNKFNRLSYFSKYYILVSIVIKFMATKIVALFEHNWFHKPSDSIGAYVYFSE